MQMKERILLLLLIAGFLLQNIDAKAVQKDFCDGKKDGLYPDPENCTFYYSCFSQITYRMPCPASLIFDPSLNVCNWPRDVSKERQQKCTVNSSNEAPLSTRQPTTTTTKKNPRPEKKPKINDKMPRSLEMRFNLGTKSVALNITQKPETSSTPKILTAERGRITEWNSNETYALYESQNRTASIVVSTNGKKGDTLTYRGNFNVDGKRYILKPQGAMNIVPSTGKDKHITYNGTKYLVAEEDVLPPTCSNFRAARDGDTVSPSPTLQEVVLASDTPPVSSSIKQQYGVELFLVIDYSTYYKFYLQSTAYTAQDKKSDAILSLRHYFAHIVNGIDNRYTSINETDFGMYVRLVGYYIATTPYDSPWTEGYGIKSNGIYSDSSKALTSFEKWISDNAAVLPNFDSAALFSSNRLLYYRTDGSSYTISGLAYIGSSCTSQKVSVNYEFGEYSSIETGAHELGHNLGAWHDDPNYNNCDGRQQFIMASAPSQLTDATFQNPFHFSTCSVDSFRKYMTLLNNENRNCLLNEAMSSEPSDFNAFLRQWPGQKYKPDQQCQLLYGQNSYYCAGGSRDRSICREMKCWSPTSYTCYANVEQRAFDGTTCANGSWCYRGECVPNDMAPSAPQSCIYGDYRGTFPIDGRDYTCSEIGYYSPWRCYDSGYSGDCCATCNSIKDASKQGCEYGDREPSWCNANLRSFDCYDSTTRTRCCSTCSRYFRNITGCEYGDRDNSWCPSVSAAQCYSSSSTCCFTCRNYYTGLQGCEYGDKTTGCGSYVSYCLTDSNIANSCCGTCNAAYPRISTTTTTTTTTMPTTSTTTTTTTRPITTSTTTMSSTTRTTTTTTPPSGAANSSCPLGDGASYCSSMPVLDCYVYSGVCCATCAKHFNASRPGCEYGDQVPWCSTYVQGPTECQRPEVKQYCCETCPKYLSGALEPVCSDKANWCTGMHPGYCYDPATEETCCATCKSYKRSQESCKYGDKFSWCDPIYCGTNAYECCESCK